MDVTLDVDLDGAAIVPVPVESSGLIETLTCRIGSAIDNFALQGMSLMYGGVLAAVTLHPGGAGGSDACPSNRSRVGSDADAANFFSFLGSDDRHLELCDEWAVARLPGGTIFELVFQSSYTSFDGVQGRIRAGWLENAAVRVRHWKHTDGRKRPTVLLLHGFGMGALPWIDARVLCASQWFASGVDVALLTLPLHGSRCPRDVAYSGAAFASWDVAHVNESVRESVHDIDGVLRFLAESTDAGVGLVGFSLGGYLAALVAGLSSRPAFVVPIMAPVSLGELPARLFAMRRGADCAPPITSADFAAGCRVHSPLQYPLAIDAERVMIVAGRADAFVPPEHAHELWAHWNRPKIHWISGGHLTPFGRSTLVDVIRRQFEPLGFDVGGG